jgi:hypothetical protein
MSVRPTVVRGFGPLTAERQRCRLRGSFIKPATGPPVANIQTRFVLHSLLHRLPKTSGAGTVPNPGRIVEEIARLAFGIHRVSFKAPMQFRYTAGHKPENQSWTRAEWKQTKNNRPAKFYLLTGPRRNQLQAESANWNRLSSAISRVVGLRKHKDIRPAGSLPA